MNEPKRHRRTKAEQADFYAEAVRISLRLFSEGGLEAISMRQLAAELGVAPMSLYRYFPTKTALLSHIWDEILLRAHEQAERNIERNEPPLRKLRAYLSGFLQYWLENTDHYYVVFSAEGSKRDHRMREHADLPRPNLQPMLEALRRLVNECMAPADRPEDDRCYHAQMLMCKSLGFLMSTIGIGFVPAVEVPHCKELLLDEMMGQVERQGRLS